MTWAVGRGRQTNTPTNRSLIQEKSNAIVCKHVYIYSTSQYTGAVYVGITVLYTCTQALGTGVRCDSSITSTSHIIRGALMPLLQLTSACHRLHDCTCVYTVYTFYKYIVHSKILRIWKLFGFYPPPPPGSLPPLNQSLHDCVSHESCSLIFSRVVYR